MEGQSSRERLLQATIDVIRSRGYANTRVDDLAAAAGVTKGSFFHHFATKEACARAAVEHWSERAEAAFAASGHRDLGTPAERVLAYVDFRIALLEGPVAGYSCYAGSLIQEVRGALPELATACGRSMLDHARTLEADLADALSCGAQDARELAIHVQACVQGALVIARAEDGGDNARASLRHLRRYLEMRIEEKKT